MIIIFIGRSEEVNEIKNTFIKDNFDSFLIYGRRRVGKTEIIKQLVNDIDKVKYNCFSLNEFYN